MCSDTNKLNGVFVFYTCWTLESHDEHSSLFSDNLQTKQSNTWLESSCLQKSALSVFVLNNYDNYLTVWWRCDACAVPLVNSDSVKEKSLSSLSDCTNHFYFRSLDCRSSDVTWRLSHSICRRQELWWCSAFRARKTEPRAAESEISALWNSIISSVVQQAAETNVINKYDQGGPD